MKFRKLVIVLILAATLFCYFTKPSKADFMEYIRPALSGSGIPPVVDYQDKFLYATVDVMYVNALNPTIKDGRPVANASKEEYLGIFKKFWKLGD